MNFECGTSLAVFQDRLFDQYTKRLDLTISQQDYIRLNTNLWVAIASKIAPNNLVIRHRCLQGIFNGNRNCLDEIINLFNILAPGLFVEGYSYWVYTKYILQAWAELYHTPLINKIKFVDLNFSSTSYIKDGKKYPAPFGDLRLQPLEDHLQDDTIITDCAITPIIKRGSSYQIRAYPLGGNLHVPIKDEVIVIEEGIPQGFKFYEGYDKKYKNAFFEIIDLLNLKRYLKRVNL